MDETGEKKILPGDHLPNDEATAQLDASEPGNPRVKINAPANRHLILITDSEPPFLVIVTRADIPISSKGVLAHAHDLLLTNEVRLDKRAALTAGVAEAAGKDLRSKIAEGVA